MRVFLCVRARVRVCVCVPFVQGYEMWELALPIRVLKLCGTLPHPAVPGLTPYTQHTRTCTSIWRFTTGHAVTFVPCACVLRMIENVPLCCVYVHVCTCPSDAKGASDGAVRVILFKSFPRVAWRRWLS